MRSQMVADGRLRCDSLLLYALRAKKTTFRRFQWESVPQKVRASASGTELGIPPKSTVVGEFAASSKGRSAVEPTEESQFLHVIGEPVLDGHKFGGNRRNAAGAQRIAHFKVVLATALLSLVPPDRRCVVASRVIDRLGHLVRQSTDVATKRSAGIERKWRIDLNVRPDVERAVVAENAATAEEIVTRVSHYNVPGEEDRESADVYRPGKRPRNQGVNCGVHLAIVYDPDIPATTKQREGIVVGAASGSTRTAERQRMAPQS